VNATARLLPAAIAAVLLLSGCTTDDGATTVITATTDPAPADPAPPQRPSDDPATPDPSAPPPTGPADGNDVEPTLACTPGEITTLDDVVASQLEAMAAADWAGALALASEGFREGIGPDDLRRIILDGFPVVAGNDGHVVDGCSRTGDEARLLVTVSGRDGATSELVYLFVLEPAGWRIGGAVPTSAGEQPDTTTA
jgi:hypothetical protein